MTQQPGPAQGYSEEEHTADWELHVWAENLQGLFAEAARGMYALSGTRLAEKQTEAYPVSLEAEEVESLLVAFLNELLFLGEQQGLAFKEFDLQVEETSLNGQAHGRPIVTQAKEIKAVTYHNLEVRSTDRGYSCNLVFDV